MKKKSSANWLKWKWLKWRKSLQQIDLNEEWLKWIKSLQQIDLKEENKKNGWKKEEKLELDAAVALRLQAA